MDRNNLENELICCLVLLTFNVFTLIHFKSLIEKRNEFWYFGIVIVLRLSNDYVWQGRTRCQVIFWRVVMFGLLRRTLVENNKNRILQMFREKDIVNIFVTR